MVPDCNDYWEGKIVVYLIHHVVQMPMIRIEPDFDEAPTIIVCESCGHSMKYMLPLSGVEFGESPAPAQEVVRGDW